MRFGVNYTPRNGWFYHWLDFSADDTARDLDAIADLGVDHIRVFPLWPLLQPHRTLIRDAALADVGRVISLAAERGLDVSVDGLQGHLSSFDFLPAWLTSWHRRNLFTHPDVVASTAEYLTRLAQACADHPNLMALTVGNEVNQFAGAVHPEPFPATEAEAGAWTHRMVDALRAGLAAGGRDHDVAVLHACYDATWYDPAQPFTPTLAATVGDITAVHSWVFNGTAQLYGAEGFETGAHGRYLVEVARAFQLDPARPVWVQEIGAPGTVIPPESTEHFMRATFAQLIDAPDLFGVTWWSSHDVDPALADFPPVEYTLGLIDQAGHIKPEGRIFRELVHAARASEGRGDGVRQGDGSAVSPCQTPRQGDGSGVSPCQTLRQQNRPLVSPSQTLRQRNRPPVSASQTLVPGDRAGSGATAESDRPTLILDLKAVGGRAALAPGGAFWQTYMEQARSSGHPRIVIEGDRHA